MSDDCEFMPEHGAGVVLKCGNCEGAFRIQLLEPGFSDCPHCKQQYTHLLLVCAAENGRLFLEACDLVAEANAGDDDDNDQADDDQADDDQGDDDDDQADDDQGEHDK